MKTSQVQTVLQHLQKYGTLTSLQAFEKWHVTRLASVIEVLRKWPYDEYIETELVKSGSTRYAKYHYVHSHD